MTYEEYVRIRKSANSKEISNLIKFAMRNPGEHVEFLKRYNREKDVK